MTAVYEKEILGTTSTAKPQCKCADAIDKKLAELGDELVLGFTHDGAAFPIIATQKKKNVMKRGRSKTTLFPTFCPFCGKAYR